MKIHLVHGGWIYLIAVLLALGLKFHYSTAESPGLLWVLEPTARLVSLFTHIDFVFVETEGFVNRAGNIVIAPACAGVNFLIICFCMLVFAHLHRFPRQVSKAAWLFASGFVALFFTLMVNATRIIFSINSFVLPGSHGWLTPDRVHRLEGICIYFFALSVLYYASEILLKRLIGFCVEAADNSTQSGARFLMPFF